MTRRLLLFANSFPYGKQEPYLMRECRYLDAFDEVYIFSLSIRKHQRDLRRDLPLEQVTVVPVPFKSPLFYAAVSPSSTTRSLPRTLPRVGMSFRSRGLWIELPRSRPTAPRPS